MHPAKKDLVAELVKMVMVCPFSDKVEPAPPSESPPVVELVEDAPADAKPEAEAVSIAIQILNFIYQYVLMSTGIYKQIGENHPPPPRAVGGGIIFS